MFCKECGTKNESAGGFCSSCGAQLTAPVQEKPIESRAKPIQSQVKQKAKLGISVGLFGAALYFMGLIGIIPLVLMAGYVLLCEESEWLKKVAIKAVAIVIMIGILSALVGLLGSSHSFFNNLILLFGLEVNLDWLHRIVLIFHTIISVIQTIVLLVFGLLALIQGEKFTLFDNVFGKK